MKNLTKKILNGVWLIYGLLIFIALLVPAVKIDSSPSYSYEIPVFLLLSGLSINISTSTSASINAFYGILTAVLFFVPIFFEISNKRLNQFIGLSIMMVLFAFVLMYSSEIEEIKETLGNDAEFSAPGITIITIATVIGFLLSIVSLVVELAGDKIEEILAKSKAVNLSKEQLLEENRALFDKGLITQEEYESRRTKILG